MFLSGQCDRIPDLGATIVVARRHQTSIWRPGERVGLIARRQRGQIAPGARVPELERTIVARGGETRAVGRPANAIDCEWKGRLMKSPARVPKPGAQLRAGRRIPEGYMATPISRGQFCAVGRPCRREYWR